MRRPFVASAILAALLIPPLGALTNPPATASTTDAERATAALHYLWMAQKPNGSIDGSIGETADFVIGAAAAGYDPATLTTCAGTDGALGFLATASDAASGDAAKTGKAILAVVAAGGNPASFQGRDLNARLAALYHSDTGAYQDGSTFAQSFAILSLEAEGATIPAAALTELESLQGTDGSWSYGTTAPAPGDGDTNSTAIALMALDRAGRHSADAAALTYLHSQQLSDGGFPYQNSSTYGPPASDPDSDSIVLQALLTAGQDPESASWLQSGSSVLTQLRSMQGPDGGFSYPGMGESAFTTSQVPAALMRAPYGAAVTFTPGRSLPAIDCPTATSSPTVSPTVSPTPTVRPTLRPTPRPTVRPAPRPTVRPTVKAVTTPTIELATSPTPEPPATATATPAATPTSNATNPAASPTSNPANHGDSPQGSGSNALIYGIAALAGLGGMVGAGWFLMPRGPKR